VARADGTCQPLATPVSTPQHFSRDGTLNTPQVFLFPDRDLSVSIASSPAPDESGHVSPYRPVTMARTNDGVSDLVAQSLPNLVLVHRVEERTGDLDTLLSVATHTHPILVVVEPERETVKARAVVGEVDGTSVLFGPHLLHSLFRDHGINLVDADRKIKSLFSPLGKPIINPQWGRCSPRERGATPFTTEGWESQNL